MEINDILLEWSYRLEKGYPTMEDGKFTEPSELKVLHEILKENGINEMPSFVKSKTPVSDVVTEAEEEEKPSVPSRVSKEMLYKAIDKLEPDQLSDKAIRILYGKIQTFLTFKPLRRALKSKKFPIGDKFDMPKKIANELQQMLLNMDKGEYESFVDWIDPERRKENGVQLSFPPKDKKGKFSNWGNLVTDMPEFLSKNVTKAFAAYAGQDEKGRGVGMGEILMTLVFDNIEAATGGGDLAFTDGKKLEVKGSPAVLGSLSPILSYDAVSEIFKEETDIKFKIAFGKPDPKKNPSGQKKGKFPFIGKKELRKSQLAELISYVAKKETEGATAAAKSIFTKLLEESGIDTAIAQEAAELVGEKWDKPIIVNRAFGLANFIRYAKKEGFKGFLALSYGKKGNESGDYLYVEGDPSKMAQALMSADAPFKGASVESLWPRIDVSKGKQTSSEKVPTNEEELEEELDY